MSRFCISSLLKSNPEFATAFKYLLVGLTGQFLDYKLTLAAFGMGAGLIFSNSLGYFVASTLTYFLHTVFSFGRPLAEVLEIKSILHFSIACLVGASVGALILVLLVGIGLPISTSKILQLFSSAVLQYGYNRLITFKGHLE